MKSFNQSGVTVLLIEQNAKAALKLADRGYVLEVGKIMAKGTSKELLASPEIQRNILVFCQILQAIFL